MSSIEQQHHANTMDGEFKQLVKKRFHGQSTKDQPSEIGIDREQTSTVLNTHMHSQDRSSVSGQNNKKETSLKLQVQIKKEKGATMLQLKRRKANADDFYGEEDSPYMLQRSKEDYVPDFVRDYELRKMQLEEEQMFPQEEVMTTKRYAYLHRKLNFLEHKNELKTIIGGIRDNHPGNRKPSHAPYEDEDAYPEGAGIVEKKNEDDQEIKEALHVALQKGLITNN